MLSLGSGLEHAAGSIRIIIVDDHPIVRMGLRAMLERAPGLQVVGEAGDCRSALALAETVQPDIALVDVNLPYVDGFDIAKLILEISAPTRVVMLSGAFDSSTLRRGTTIGVRGFILKMESPQKLTALIREIHLGGFCCSEGLCPPVTPDSEEVPGAEGEKSRLHLLSEKEQAMLIQLAKGASLKEAAKAIGISYKSADRVKQRVMKKLDIHDRVAIARFAIHEGLIS
ncbi:MAG TPA: response regulator transcription factor [Planctomycetaceae bacterium]|jgi:DNA-binding NarL/FixJ family response regulator